MPKYINIGYGDRAGYDRTPQDVRQAAHEHDASLKQRGVVMGIAETPVQVRNPDASGVLTETGPYLSSDLPIAGFSIMEASDMDEAIALASKSPCAVAHGVIEKRIEITSNFIFICITFPLLYLVREIDLKLATKWKSPLFDSELGPT